MPRGVYIEIRHEKGCPATRRDNRACRCAPTARARVAGAWVLNQRLERNWKLKDLDALELAAAETKRDHETGRKVIEKHTVPKLADWGDDFIAEIAALVVDEDYSPATLATYRSLWTKHLKPEVGDLLLTHVTPARVNALRAELGKSLAPRSVRAAMGVLSAMLSGAVPKYLDFNPTISRVTRRRRRPRRDLVPVERIVAPDFAKALLASTQGVLHDMILCGLTTGMRKAEIMGLRVDQLDLRKGRIRVASQLGVGGERGPKWDSVRTTIACPTLAARLQLRLEHTDSYVFLNHGDPFTASRVGSLLNEAWEAIGERPERHSWHVLRHTFATTLRGGGVHQFVIDDLMGHSKRGMGSLYQHVLDAELEAATKVVQAAFGEASDSSPELGAEKKTGPAEADPATRTA